MVSRSRDGSLSLSLSLSLARGFMSRLMLLSRVIVVIIQTKEKACPAEFRWKASGENSAWTAQSRISVPCRDGGAVACALIAAIIYLRGRAIYHYCLSPRACSPDRDVREEEEGREAGRRDNRRILFSGNAVKRIAPGQFPRNFRPRCSRARALLVT